MFFAMFTVFGVGLFSTANDLELQPLESVILASHKHKPTIGSSITLLVISKRGQNTIALYLEELLLAVSGHSSSVFLTNHAK